MHPSTSLSCRSTKCIFQCTDSAGRHPLPPPHLCIIPFFCIQFLHCILTSVAAFQREPYHRIPFSKPKLHSNSFMCKEPKEEMYLRWPDLCSPVVFVHSFHGIKERIHVGQLPTAIDPGTCLMLLLCIITKGLLLLLCAKSRRILSALKWLSQVPS